jgi:hypothetical protein
MTRATGRAAANVPKIASANAESKLASGWALPATMLVSPPDVKKPPAGTKRRRLLIGIRFARGRPTTYSASWGKIDAERRRNNWEVQLKAARDQIIKHLGSAAMTDAFIDSFMRYQDREDTASYCTLFIVSGRKPTTAI